MLISLAICILALVVMFKITGFFLGLFGKLLGILFSGLGYVLLGIVLISVIGATMVIIPIIFIVGIISIITNLIRV